MACQLSHSSSVQSPSSSALHASNENHPQEGGVADIHRTVEEAQVFLHDFRSKVTVDAQGLLTVAKPEKWAQQLVRRRGIAEAVLEKIGSNAFIKRRPEDQAPYERYVRRVLSMEAPLLFRIPVGPIKNMHLAIARQAPDLAEYLMFTQLARFAYAIAQLYPHGVKMQIVPDDVRARAANRCPDDYVESYVSGMRALVEAMGLSSWLHVENGQMRLCDLYKVNCYREEAERKLSMWKESDPNSFTMRWEAALENARKNFVVEDGADCEAEIASSAWRYMVAHQSEILSGMWSPIDAFPLVYANHPNCFQIFSMGTKKTKLPWQITMPVDLLGANANPISSLFERAAPSR